MDAINASRAGWSAGVGLGEAVLKFDSSVYANRIDELGRIKQNLDDHLDKLKNLKAEVPSFWDDSLGGNVASVVDDWIENIKEANRKIEIMQHTFKERMESIEGRIAEGEEAVEAIKATSKVVSGIAGVDDL